MRAIFDVIRTFGDNVFFEQLKGGALVKTTYAEFEKKTAAAAAGLQAVIKVPAGAFVGLEMDNSPEWVIGFWAILQAGYKPVLLNTRLPLPLVDEIIAETKAAAVLTDKPKRAIDIDINALPADAGEAFRAGWEDCFALSTSGTSGRPKIYLYNGASMSEQISNSKYVLKENPTIKTYYKGQIKLLAFLPFYHIFGLIATLMWFSFFGRTFVFLNDMRPETIQYACRRHGVTHVFAIPAVFNGVAMHVRREARRDGEKSVEKLERALNLSIKLQSAFPWLGKRIASKIMFSEVRRRILGDSVKFCISGGGYIRDDALKVFNGLGYSLYNGYGMTEIGIASVELRLSAKKRLLGSIGKPFPSIEYGLSKEGVLSVKGGSIFYARLIDGEIAERSRDAWFETQDILERDRESGYYYIKGRKDDIIIADNGENIIPDLIEKRFELAYAKSYSVIGMRKDEKAEVILIVYPDPKASATQVDEM
ncbi:MAG: AMP-binding protein, partial [Clostridiales bacterium]|nr:AMP-binding protein [Clostridiales bacterium]